MNFTFNLIKNLNEEIDRDVQLAQGEDEQAHHERHWPERVERQAEAFRRILDRHRPVDASVNHAIYINCATCRVGEPHDEHPVAWPCEEIRNLAAVYDFRISTGDEIRAAHEAMAAGRARHLVNSTSGHMLEWGSMP